MKLNDVSLPYPVLGINDDIYPLLESDAIIMPDPEVDERFFNFSIRLNQYNSDITNLIQNGQAEYMCEIHCQRTMLRKCITSPDQDLSVTLDRKSLSGKVEFNCYIIVKDYIADYRNSECNPDYKGYGFDLEPGDILAVFPQRYYNVDIKYDKLYAAGSFMQMVESPNDKPVPWVKLDDDKIQIMLPKDMYRQYDENIGRDNHFIEMIHSSIIMNALVYALHHINDSRYSDNLWVDAIKHRVNANGEFKDIGINDVEDIQDHETIDALAQRIMGNPYNRMFNHMTQMLQGGAEED